jgi:16S rRNA (cytosine967-C5)-methyltransferase
MRSHSYLNSTKAIIASYDGSLPLAAWLKQYFRLEKKFGSKDRKQVAHLCYCYYRLGNSFQKNDIEDKILMGVFLCSGTKNFVLQELKPEWNEMVDLPLEKKIDLVFAHEETGNIFPFNEELSQEINKGTFNRSFLIQPEVYLRIRPKKKEKVLDALKEKNIPFSLPADDCIQMASQINIDEILSIDEDVVVQDFNSQKVIGIYNNFITVAQHQTPNQASGPKLIWDCCAASGGKSILFHDHYPQARLSLSDVRKTILINLQKRFEKAGIKSYESFVADVSSPQFSIQKKFDLVICDAPCSGSGTWSRTPEQLSFFNKEKIGYYADLQKRIVSNAAKAVNKNGYFLYITCSVFSKENEEVVEYVQNNLPLQLCDSQYLKGYDRRADSLFVALFRSTF